MSRATNILEQLGPLRRKREKGTFFSADGFTIHMEPHTNKKLEASVDIVRTAQPGEGTDWEKVAKKVIQLAAQLSKQNIVVEFEWHPVGPNEEAQIRQIAGEAHKVMIDGFEKPHVHVDRHNMSIFHTHVNKMPPEKLINPNPKKEKKNGNATSVRNKMDKAKGHPEGSVDGNK